MEDTRIRWCRHFTGIQHKECAKGITYESVKDSSVRPYRWPCLSDESRTTCPSLSRETAEEEAAFLAEATAQMQRHVESIARGVCPECNQAMHKRQVGPCVYAEPCGHRLYQVRA